LQEEEEVRYNKKRASRRQTGVLFEAKRVVVLIVVGPAVIRTNPTQELSSGKKKPVTHLNFRLITSRFVSFTSECQNTATTYRQAL
jgi:hypothetical protein